MGLTSAVTWAEVMLFAPPWTHIELVNEIGDPSISAQDAHNGFYGAADWTARGIDMVAVFNLSEPNYYRQFFWMEILDPRGKGDWPALGDDFNNKVHALQASATVTLTVSN